MPSLGSGYTFDDFLRRLERSPVTHMSPLYHEHRELFVRRPDMFSRAISSLSWQKGSALIDAAYHSQSIDITAYRALLARMLCHNRAVRRGAAGSIVPWAAALRVHSHALLLRGALVPPQLTRSALRLLAPHRQCPAAAAALLRLCAATGTPPPPELEPTAGPRAQLEAGPRAELEAGAEPRGRARGRARARAQLETRAGARADLEAGAELEARAGPTAGAELEAGPRAEPRAQLEAGPRAEPRAQLEAGARAELEPGAEPRGRAGGRARARAQLETRARAQLEAGAEARASAGARARAQLEAGVSDGASAGAGREKDAVRKEIAPSAAGEESENIASLLRRARASAASHAQPLPRDAASALVLQLRASRRPGLAVAVLLECFVPTRTPLTPPALEALLECVLAHARAAAAPAVHWRTALGCATDVLRDGEGAGPHAISPRALSLLIHICVRAGSPEGALRAMGHARTADKTELAMSAEIRALLYCMVYKRPNEAEAIVRQAVKRHGEENGQLLERLCETAREAEKESKSLELSSR